MPTDTKVFSAEESYSFLQRHLMNAHRVEIVTEHGSQILGVREMWASDGTLFLSVVQLDSESA